MSSRGLALKLYMSTLAEEGIGVGIERSQKHNNAAVIIRSYSDSAERAACRVVLR